MASGSDLISGALRVITSITPGENIPGAEADNALTVLNRMLRAWSAKSLMVPYRTLETFTLIPGKASYSIGPGADFDTIRPDYVTSAWRRDMNNLDYPLEIITKDRYNVIWQKSLEGLPYQIYYDDQFPNGMLYFYPTDLQSDTLFLETLKPVNQFSTLSTVMALPGEYEEAIVYLLAQRLAPEYGFSISSAPDIAQLVKEADEFIKRKNTRPQVAAFDAALRRPWPFDIRSG